MAKIYFGHSTNYDYISMYEELQKSALNLKHEIFFPHINNRNNNTVEIIKNCKFFIAEVSQASTGLGIEIGIAVSKDIPVICVYKKGSNPSRALQFISKVFIEYTDLPNMRNQLEKFINTIQKV